LTQEKIDELNERYNRAEEELRLIQERSEVEQWTIELDEFVKNYNEWLSIHCNLDKKPVKVVKKK
jgi:hypothetical protein